MFDLFGNYDNSDWSLINSLLIACSEPISGDYENDVNSLYDFESSDSDRDSSNNESNINV